MFLLVKIYVAVNVAMELVVDSSISHRELFVDARHKVGCLFNECVGLQSIVQASKRRLIVVDGHVARSQRAVSASGLIDIAKTFEDVERLLLSAISFLRALASMRCSLMACMELASQEG